MVNFKMIYTYSLNSQEVNITKKEIYVSQAMAEFIQVMKSLLS